MCQGGDHQASLLGMGSWEKTKRAMLVELHQHPINNNNKWENEEWVEGGISTARWRRSRGRELLFGGQGERDDTGWQSQDNGNDVNAVEHGKDDTRE